jgi:hypothetical protein
MSGAIKLALGIGSGISWITYAVVAGIGLAAGTAGAAAIEEIRLDRVEAQRDANHDLLLSANKQLSDMTARNASNEATIAKQQASMDALDAKARAIQADQAGRVATLTEQRRAAQNQTSQILDTLKGQIDVKTVPSPDVIPDFDPVVSRGIAWLQCLQSARARGLPAASCAGGPAVSAGGSDAPGSATGARRYAPTVDQQLWLLGLVYRFRDWAVACYDDKVAISATEGVGESR